MSDETVKSVIRGAVPSVVGAVTAWAAKHGLDSSNTTAIALMPVAATAYTAAVHYLESKYPRLGWLLGALPTPKTPQK